MKNDMMSFSTGDDEDYSFLSSPEKEDATEDYSLVDEKSSSSSSSNIQKEVFIPHFKLLLIGHEGVGQKEMFANLGVRLNTTTNITQYGFVQVEVDTNRGPIKFIIYDINKCLKNGLPLPLFFQDANCALLMFDTTKRQTYEQIRTWHSTIVQVCGNKTPIALMGIDNTLSLNDVAKTPPPNLRKKYLKYFECIINKHEDEIFFKVTNSFLWFARKLSGDNQLYFVERRRRPTRDDDEELPLLDNKMVKLGITDDDDVVPTWVMVDYLD